MFALIAVGACSGEGSSDNPLLPPSGTTAGTAAAPPTAGTTTTPSTMAGQSAVPSSAAGAGSARPGMTPSQPGAQAGSMAMAQAGTTAGMQPGSMSGAQAGTGASTQAGAPAMMPSDMMPTMPGEPMAMGGTLPPVTSVKDMGPFAVTIDKGMVAGGGWVARPTDLGKDGIKHPIFLWGCGGGSEPSQYMDHMTLIASHGFVMESHVSSGDASDHKAPLDWLLAENEKSGSPFYQKLDVTKIAAGGHSMGSNATFAFEGDTDKLTTSIHVAGGSWDGSGFMRLKTPTLHIGGVNDTLAGSNTMRDWERTTVPTFYTNIEDTDHILAARNGLPVMLAWMRWHLAGEVERKDMFIGADCEFCKAPYNGMSKNWK
jgi:hypothetical protein